MTILRTTLAITGLVLSSANLQAAFITDASASGGTNFSSSARAINGSQANLASSNFACPGGGTSSAGGTAVNPSANITCEGARGFASADLVTASLRAFALSSGGLNTASSAFANAQFSDEVFFNNSTGGALLLPFSYRTHATVAGETFGVSTRTALLGNLLLSQPGGSQPIALQGGILHGLRFSYINGSASIQDPNAGGPADLGGWTITPVGPVGSLWGATLAVPSGISTLDIATILSLDCRGFADCDASNTSAFSFGALPTGLSYTSSSGAFLTAAPAGVPEPGTWAMLSVGLLTIGFLRRRKKDGNA